MSTSIKGMPHQVIEFTWKVTLMRRLADPKYFIVLNKETRIKLIKETAQIIILMTKAQEKFWIKQMEKWEKKA